MNYEQKNKRKIIAILLIISLFIPIFTLNIFAVDTKFQMTSETTEVARGESFTIAVKTDNVEDIKGGFNGYSGTLAYDTARFSRNKTETSVSGWNFVYNPKANTFLGSDPTGMDFKTSDFEVFSITFEVLPSAPLGESSIELSKIAVSDSNYKNINLSNSNIKINIVDAKTENPKSSNTKLASLEVEGQTLSPKFDPDRSEYEVNVKKDVSSVNIKALLEDSKGKIVSGIGKHELKEGKNTIVVTVKAEDGSSKNYTIVINREVSKDENNDGDKDKDDKDKDKDDKDKDNDKDKDKDKDDGSKGDKNDGNNGDTNNSNTSDNQNNNSNNGVNVDVKNDSSNNFILDVQGLGNLDKQFSKDIYHYITYVGREVSKLEPIITLEDPNATYKIIGADDLKIGKNKVILQVTASNGEVKEYEFEVIRTEEENNALLSSLQVGGYAINPGFREDINYYTLNVDSNVSSLGVSASPKFGGSQINVVGHDKINYGANYIKVFVTGNQTMNTYVVEVIREQEPAKVNYLPWIINGVLGLFVIVLLLVLHFNKRIKEAELRNANYAQVAPYSQERPPYRQSRSNNVNYVYQDVNENGRTVRKKFKIVEDED